MTKSTHSAVPPSPSDESGFRLITPLNVMFLLVPVAVALYFSGATDVWVFVASGVGIIPLAGYMGKATEALAERLGPTAGGLLNATFGNAAELIIALTMLSSGPAAYQLVKYTITGSIIGNLLLVLGLAIFVGGLRFKTQTFNRTNAGVGATLLAIATAGLIFPTLFYLLMKAQPTEAEVFNVEHLSEEIALVLMVVYGLSILFTLHTHRHLMGGDREHGEPGHDHWGVGVSLAVLVVATAGIAVLSHWMVGAIEEAGHSLGMTEVFVGVIVVAIVGNAAEHSTAVLVAYRNRMDLSLQIAVGSSIQIALFVAPVLVFASVLMGHPHALDLHFTSLEVVAVILSVAITALVCHDGESNWLEGAMLLALYFIIGLAFYHVRGGGH